MKDILVVIGSARKGRVAEKVARYVQEDLAHKKNVNVTIADLEKLHLPYFNNEHPPASPDFKEDSPEVHTWSNLVQNADAVVMVTPEYNHSLSGIQKNAIDWLGREWNGKPVVIVAYGWYGGKHSVAAIQELAPVVKMDVQPIMVQFTFGQELSTGGTALEEETVRDNIHAALAQVV